MTWAGPSPAPAWLPDAAWQCANAIKVGHKWVGWVGGGGKGRCTLSALPAGVASFAHAPTTDRCSSTQSLEGFEALVDELSGSPKRWQEWMEKERPEAEPLPGAPSFIHGVGL